MNTDVYTKKNVMERKRKKRERDSESLVRKLESHLPILDC